MKANNKEYMWYKVKELKEKGLNKSQISRQLEIDRATVRNYLSMNEQEFHLWINNPKHLPHKLSNYMKFVKTELNNYPFLSSAQIEDRLKEHFMDLPDIHSKTVYNFVVMVREKYGIEKPSKENYQQFEKLPEPPYGLQAQADFGEFYIQTTNQKRAKIYFFCIVLCRSRCKFVYFQNHPFTTEKAVNAHQLSFEYFGGVPKEIVYDQDKVFIHDENLGDYLLTHQFKAFYNEQKFKPVFCKKADPQSKGKIENVVKYIKNNFLRGRQLISIENLNQSAMEWLKRTANSKKHGTTHKIPLQELEIEKQYLSPIKNKAEKPEILFQEYNVRKDNTVAYRGNFYSLPLGTYQGSQTKILVEILEEKINFYTHEKLLLASHSISLNKGELVRNTDHVRNKTTDITQTLNQVKKLLGESEKSTLFLELLKTDKPRYFHDNLRVLRSKLLSEKEKNEDLKSEIEKTLEICLEHQIYNANIFSQIIDKEIKLRENQLNFTIPDFMTQKKDSEENKLIINLKPQTSNINQYEKYFKICKP